MSQAIEQIRAAVAQRPAELAQTRAAGRKVVGWIGYNIPEELIEALGMTPVRICQGGDAQLAALGGEYISTQNCFFLRQTVGMFAKGDDPYIQQLDAVATDTTCLQLHRMSSVLGYYFKARTIQLGASRDPKSPDGREFFLHEIENFVRQLEEIAGEKLDTARLAESMKLYQRIHAAVRELYAHAAKGAVRWREVFEAVHAGFVLDRTAYCALLEAWLKELTENTTPLAAPKNVARIVLTGSVLASGDTKLLDIIESAGAEVAGDLVWSGLGAKQDLTFNEYTLKGLVDAYLDRFPHAAIPCVEVESDRKLTALVELVKQSRAQGVIYHSLRYCDPFSFKMLSTKEYLKRAKIPLLEVQSDYGSLDIETARNRVCAFVEMLA